MSRLTRRRALLAGAGCLLPAWQYRLFAAPKKKLPVAAVVTVYHENSHADVIVGKILEGYQQDGGPGPDLELVALYVDQVPPQDLSRSLARRHGFRLARSIEEALTLGKGRLQVRGVLSIGEHGRYPQEPRTGQVMYPRKRFFDQIVQVFRRTGQVVPVFNDKHLSYNWAGAWAMYRTAREMKVPLLAGSSLPVAWRVPALSWQQPVPLQRAVAYGYGGLESYGFHALEMLQCMVENRRGGETGVRWVQAVRRDALRDRWAWVPRLTEAAVGITGQEPRRVSPEAEHHWYYLVQYTDGFQAAVAMNAAGVNQFAFAARLAGKSEPVATWFALQEGKPYLHFAYLVRAIEHLIRTGKPPYPVERTLLTTGVLHAAMRSIAAGGKQVPTPELERLAYQPSRWPHAPGRPPRPRG